MGRSLAGVLVVVALVLGIALLDEGRDRDGADGIVAAQVERAGSQGSQTSQGGETEAFGGGSLTDCLGALGADPPDESTFPGLDQRGVDQIARRVEGLRELKFGGPVDANFLAPGDLDARILELSGGGAVRELARRQGAALELLGAIPDGDDLYELTTDTLEDQVVGLYAPETKELLVSASGSPGAVEEITLAHELEHALADDDLGLPLAGRVRAGEGDAALAAQALIEGDATLTMQLYALRYVSLGDQLDIGSDPEVAGAGLGDIPDILRRQLLFPYEAGLQFVCDRYAEGGWDAVDEAYADPPTSTAELLGLRDTDPVEPPPSGALEKPWRPILRDQLGAATLAWLFAAPGGEPDRAIPAPRDAIAGWAGDRVTLWERGKGAAAVQALSLTIVDEGGTLCGATVAWYAATDPDAELGREGDTTTFAGADRDAAITCDGGTVRLGIAPDAALAATLSS